MHRDTNFYVKSEKLRIGLDSIMQAAKKSIACPDKIFIKKYCQTVSVVFRDTLSIAKLEQDLTVPENFCTDRTCVPQI